MREEEWLKITSKDMADTNYYKLGDDLVFRGSYMYNYDFDCWRYAPDFYFEYLMQSNDMDKITKKEASAIVKKNGGKNFDNWDKVLFVSKDGKYVGL